MTLRSSVQDLVASSGELADHKHITSLFPFLAGRTTRWCFVCLLWARNMAVEHGGLVEEDPLILW